jgi:hypothetical protein
MLDEVITVVTAVHSDGHRHLPEAYESLRAQELPAGWSWQWCVQEDGDSGVPGSVLPADPRISLGTGLPARAGVARTMALARAGGSLVRTLDADDVLLPGALRRDIEALGRSAWCVSACLDLYPDGRTEPGPYDPPSGPLPSRLLYRQQLRDRLSVVGATFAAHTGLIWALGGWTALTGAETVGLLLAAEAVAPGEFIAEPSLLYRKHPAQTTASNKYWDPEESRARLTIALRRARALHRLGWTWSPAPAPGP